MNPSDFLGITVIGIGASILVQFIKSTFGTKSLKTKAILIAVSIVTGAGYYFLQLHQDLFQIVVTILGIASAFYAFFIKK